MDIQKRVRYQATLFHLRNKIVLHDNYDEYKIKKHMKKIFDMGLAIWGAGCPQNGDNPCRPANN